MARTGRRPAGTDTRALILDAAREQFAQTGYDAVSLRGIARAAGVDPALVHHYFDGKSALFAEVLEFPVSPASVLPHILDGDLDELGERLVRFFLGLWQSPETGPRMAAAIRTALSSEAGSAALSGFVVREIMHRVAARLGPDRPLLRTSLVGSQLVGLGVARYLVRIEPLVSASDEEVVAAVAPTLQRYLTGELGDCAEPIA
ncbi:TetR family transcriptional regulator [soil metagenome]